MGLVINKTVAKRLNNQVVSDKESIPRLKVSSIYDGVQRDVV